MIIYPAIDLLDGKCVRLSQGNYDTVTIYSEKPDEFAALWTSKGAKFIHVVDLNGARTGKPENDDVLKKIVENAGVPIQVGGGIRSIERISKLMDLGINRVILGTGAVRNPEFVSAAVAKFGDRIVVGIDARDGYVAVDGWEKKSSRRAVEFAHEMENIGVETIIYTDITRDGMLTGPNLAAMETMAASVDCDVIASGGVSCVKDIAALYKTGVTGVITGKALYEKRLDLTKANTMIERLLKES